MRLFVPTMEAVLIEFDDAGRVRFDEEGEWVEPSIQERRAIIHAARNELESLTDLLQVLESES
jgi:hypothetical protein